MSAELAERQHHETEADGAALDTDTVGVQQVADHHNITTRTATNWIHAGVFPGAYKIGRDWRVPRRSMLNPVVITPKGAKKIA